MTYSQCESSRFSRGHFCRTANDDDGDDGDDNEEEEEEDSSSVIQTSYIKTGCNLHIIT